MAGGMGGSGLPTRSLEERLGLEPAWLKVGSDVPVRKPHVWIGSTRDHRQRPGLILRQARHQDDNTWWVQVSWVAQDPQHPAEAEHRVQWMPAADVSPA